MVRRVRLPVHCAPLERQTFLDRTVYKHLAPLEPGDHFVASKSRADAGPVAALPPGVRKASGLPINCQMNSGLRPNWRGRSPKLLRAGRKGIALPHIKRHSRR